MKSVRFLAESKASSGAVYKDGEIHKLDDHAADHWIKRGAAEVAEPRKDTKPDREGVTEEKQEPAQKDAPVEEAKPARVFEPEVKSHKSSKYK